MVVAIPTIAKNPLDSNDGSGSKIVRKTTSSPEIREYTARKSAVNKGLPPLFRISAGIPRCPGDILLLRPLIASFTSSMAKGLSIS